MNWLDTLIEREISGAPVVDNQGHLIGVVSMTDIGRNMAEPPDDVISSRDSSFYRDAAVDSRLDDLAERYVEERTVTVRDIMTPVIHQVQVTASVAEVARISRGDTRWSFPRLDLQSRPATIFNRSMLVMMPTGSLPCVTTNR
jgi:CBS domain-containing protein